MPIDGMNETSPLLLDRPARSASSVTVRRAVYALLNIQACQQHPRLRRFLSGARAVESLVLSAILANVVLVSITPYKSKPYFPRFVICCCVFFTLEYLLMMWSCVEADAYAELNAAANRRGRRNACCVRWWCRLQFALNPSALLDLICLVPFYPCLIDIGPVRIVFGLFSVSGLFSDVFWNVSRAISAISECF